jgi:hypothetical protein
MSFSLDRTALVHSHGVCGKRGTPHRIEGISEFTARSSGAAELGSYGRIHVPCRPVGNDPQPDPLIDRSMLNQSFDVSEMNLAWVESTSDPSSGTSPASSASSCISPSSRSSARGPRTCRAGHRPSACRAPAFTWPVLPDRTGRIKGKVWNNVRAMRDWVQRERLHKGERESDPIPLLTPSLP